LDNDFTEPHFQRTTKDKLDFIFGGGWNKYEGSHFGKVIWARFASQSELETNIMTIMP
jgi:iron complex outermembrane receptor protein